MRDRTLMMGKRRQLTAYGTFLYPSDNDIAPCQTKRKEGGESKSYEETGQEGTICTGKELKQKLLLAGCNIPANDVCAHAIICHRNVAFVWVSVVRY